MAEGRAKEIGIRKVLGASVAKITVLLSGEFMLLALIGAVIALPLSYYLLKKWFSNTGILPQDKQYSFLHETCKQIILIK